MLLLLKLNYFMFLLLCLFCGIPLLWSLLCGNEILFDIFLRHSHAHFLHLFLSRRKVLFIDLLQLFGFITDNFLLDFVDPRCQLGLPLI